MTELFQQVMVHTPFIHALLIISGRKLHFGLFYCFHIKFFLFLFFKAERKISIEIMEKTLRNISPTFYKKKKDIAGVFDFLKSNF